MDSTASPTPTTPTSPEPTASSVASSAQAALSRYTVRWRRHPADIARLVAAAALLALALAITAAYPEAVRGASTDVARLFRRLPLVIRQVLLGATQLAGVLAPLVVVGVMALGRRWRTLGAVAVAAASAATTMALLQDWLDRTVPPVVLRTETIDSWLTGAAFPSGAYLAAAAAVATTWGAELSREWRRALWLGVAVATVTRIITAVAAPLNLVVTLAVGGVAGSAVLAAVGAPVRRTGRVGIEATLAQLGLAARLEDIDVGAHHSRTFATPPAIVGSTDTSDSAGGHEGGEADRRPLFVKSIGRDERDADLMLRLYRALRIKGIDDERPGWSPYRVVQHEALSTLLADSAGVPVAPVLAVAETDAGDGVLALGRIDGLRLADLEPAQISAELLRRVWEVVADLHVHGTAHRWCNTHHILVGPATEPATGPATEPGRREGPAARLIDFRWARLRADRQTRDIDVAELLASLALLVGPDRAVASAASVLEPTRLGAALPLLQPLVLSPETREGLKRQPDLLDRLRTTVQTAAQVESYQLAELQRISATRLVGLFGGTLLVYVILSFASNWAAISDALGEADWSRLPAIVIVTALTFVAGGLSLAGAVSSRTLPLGTTSQVMLGQSFLNRFTPANAGGMALRVRYLQKQGVDLTESAASIGITSGASGLAQVVLLLGFSLWAGAGGSHTFSLPDVSTVALGLAIVLAIGGVALATPWGRRVVFGPLVVTVRKLIGTVTALAHQPRKLALLFGGATLSKLLMIAAFVESCRAFGIGASVAQLGLLYMTANTVASAAPTPGGLGAIEAALVAVLTGIDVDPAIALSTVLVFRLVTYWLPIVPSWLALRHLRKTEVV